VYNRVGAGARFAANSTVPGCTGKTRDGLTGKPPEVVDTGCEKDDIHAWGGDSPSGHPTTTFRKKKCNGGNRKTRQAYSEKLEKKEKTAKNTGLGEGEHLKTTWYEDKTSWGTYSGDVEKRWTSVNKAQCRETASRVSKTLPMEKKVSNLTCDEKKGPMLPEREDLPLGAPTIFW